MLLAPRDFREAVLDFFFFSPVFVMHNVCESLWGAGLSRSEA